MNRSQTDREHAWGTIRQQLADAYQIVAYWGWDDHTYTHLSARSSESGSYYIFPFGLRFEEVTPDCLLEIDSHGHLIHGDETLYNQTGYIIHGTGYASRPDLQAIFHLHTPEIVAVSASAHGLLPISQWALHFYERIAYHSYDALALEKAQGEAMWADSGQRPVVMLRNHGCLVGGRTLQEALFYTYHLQQACKTQCAAGGVGRPWVIPDPAVCRQSVQDLLGFEPDLGARDWDAWARLIRRKAS